MAGLFCLFLSKSQLLKFLIIGLGNIGEDYVHTRHNIGFDIIDALAKDVDSSFELDRHAFYAHGKFKGKNLHLIKPTTFMNLSGKAVNYWMQDLKISPENILVVCDDIALPFGKIRMRKNGSDGGHNGLKNIIEVMGNNNFPRLRFGIGNEFSRGRQAEYVLSKWKKEEQKELPEKIQSAVEAIKSFCTIGIERTMTVFN